MLVVEERTAEGFKNEEIFEYFWDACDLTKTNKNFSLKLFPIINFKVVLSKNFMESIIAMTQTHTIKINDGSTSVNGTSLKGWVITTYEDLYNVLGPSKEGSADGKTTAEWILEGADGTVATIYDWKTSATPKDLYHWHIGGHTSKSLDLVNSVLKIETKKFKI